MSDVISEALARRIGLAAQGFGKAPTGTVGTRQLNLLIDRLNLLQIDSVNVFERSHYLPVFARLGAYDKALLDKITFTAGAPHLEYWAHEAALMRREDWALFRWRMQFYRERSGKYGSWAADNQTTLDWLRAELAEKGPLVAGEIEHEANRRSGPWWGWSEVKRGLEHLFYFGEVATAGRSRFQRRYGLAEQVISSDILELEIPREDAIRTLIGRAARAHGIGTLADLADYFRIPGAAALVAIRQLEELGELLPVRVDGWERGGKPVPAWLHAEARLPRHIDATALLSPFDPVVWYRDRALRMFGFHYRIEIYTPPPKRIFGYYVLPILLDDRVVGRLDLKSDRQAGVLRVQAAWAEEGAPTETAPRVAGLLREAARWQGLDDVFVAEKGNLAPALRSTIRTGQAR